ncbi:MAG: ABC transporter ATP-binding protein, partial [Anaerolineales bacterium]
MTDGSKTSKNPGLRPGLRRGHSQPGRIEKARNARQALQRTLPYLKPYRSVLVLVFVLMLFYTLLDLLGPYLMGVAIDRFIDQKDAPGLLRIVLLMLLVYLLSMAFQAGADFVMARVSQSALKQLRQDLFDHLQNLSLSFYDHNPAGELMSRLTNDIDAINQAVSQNVTSLVAGVLMLVGILAAMFILNVWLALTSLLIVPLTFWFTSFVARYTRRGYRSLQKELGSLNGTMEENISGQRVVKAFRRSERAIEAFQRDNEAVYRAGVFANSYALLLMPLTNVLGNLFVIV